MINKLKEVSSELDGLHNDINRGGCGKFATSIKPYVKNATYYIIFSSKSDIEYWRKDPLNAGFDHIMLKIGDKLYDSNGFHNIKDFTIISKHDNTIFKPKERYSKYITQVSGSLLIDMINHGGWNPYFDRCGIEDHMKEVIIQIFK